MPVWYTLGSFGVQFTIAARLTVRKNRRSVVVALPNSKAGQDHQGCHSGCHKAPDLSARVPDARALPRMTMKFEHRVFLS